MSAKEASLDKLTEEGPTLESTQMSVKAALDNLGVDVQNRSDARFKEMVILKQALLVFDNWSP